ncbi:MAG: YgiQ family radical SAM protein [archaeon]
MISLSKDKTGKDFDIILFTAEYYDDHPLSPAGMIARVLDAKGFNVGIIEKPKSKEDFLKLGAPRLCFCVTSGSIDSMLNNYTPLKKKRGEDEHSSVNEMPDRAVIFYCNKIREYFKEHYRQAGGSAKIAIGGIEASLRRFAHYDYWDNWVRRSILLDSRADILVFGNGEKQIIEIAERLSSGNDLRGIKGTCILSRELDEGFELLPSSKEAMDDKKKFCKMQIMFSNSKRLAQAYDNNFVLQYEYPEYTTEYLDWIYSLPFTRKLHPESLLKMARFSIVTHRGCVGNCNFCSISLHQGDKIISRSEENILNEIRRLTKHPDFKGLIDDLGGPSANMYGMDCSSKAECRKQCLRCGTLDKSHSKLLSLMRKARSIPGVKKIFVRSGIRYDLALESKEYIRELSEHHISGCLKIAPEHLSPDVLKLMNKDNSRFNEFIALFSGMNKKSNQSLRYYIMIGHPGDDEKEVMLLKERMKDLDNLEQFQLFTPTPMTVSTCMYHTGMNPFTLEKVKVVYDYNTKKKMKRILLGEPTQRSIHGRDGDRGHGIQRKTGKPRFSRRA